MQGRSPFGENNLDSASNKRADPTESPSWFSSAEKFHPGAYVLVTSSLPKVEAFCGNLQLHANAGHTISFFFFCSCFRFLDYQSAFVTHLAPVLPSVHPFHRCSLVFSVPLPAFLAFFCVIFYSSCVDLMPPFGLTSCVWLCGKAFLSFTMCPCLSLFRPQLLQAWPNECVIDLNAQISSF